MPAAGLEQVAENREGRVDRIEQPEIGDIGGGEIRQTLILLPPHAGDGAGARGENLHQAARNRNQVVAGGEIQQGRHEAWVQLEGAGFAAQHAGHTQCRVAVAILAFHQQPQILARHLDGLFAHAGVLVAEHLDFRAIPGSAVARGRSHVQAPIAILRNGQVHVERGLIRIEALSQLFGGRSAVGTGYVEDQPVRQEPGRAGDAERSARESFAADLQRGEAPGAERQAFQVELQEVLEKAILELQVLGSQKRSLGPDHRLQSPHSHSQYQNFPVMPTGLRTPLVLARAKQPGSSVSPHPEFCGTVS